MAKKENKTKNKDTDNEEFGESNRKKKTQGLSEGTRNTVLSIIFIVIAVFLTFSALGKAGVAGNAIFGALSHLFGTGYFLFPLMSFLVGISLVRSVRPKFISSSIGGGLLFFFSALSLTDVIFRTRTLEEINGGTIGNLISLPFLKLFDDTLSIILLSSIAVISLIIMFDTNITLEWSLFGKKLFGGDKEEEYEEDEDIDEEVRKAEEAADTKTKEAEKTKAEEAGAEDKEKKTKTITDKIEDFIGSGISIIKTRNKIFTPPPLSIFESDSGKPGVGDIKANANIIKRTLFNFGIDVEMDEISIGPSVTRYALKPAEGIKLSRIVGLQNDLALALAAHPIRIEAPIPGKSLVGIEIPNKTKSIVGMASLFSTKQFQESQHPLFSALGRGVSGIPYFSNIAKAPHMLIAGTTGSGKSVTIHTIIASILYRNPPERVRLIMVDPKRVELTLYNGIPHLLTGVITDPKKAILSLRWAAKEMERRYNILEAAAVKDIGSYHKLTDEEEGARDRQEDESGGEMETGRETMPYIIIIIDELADIMSAFPRELESAIVRLAQMSRAVGIHLILSTQRPSVEIITGLIKANIPSRIALQVPSQIDSRTILDAPGAEKLLGAGDMLYIGGETSKPVRIQSGYISEGEIKKLVKFLKERHQDDLPDEINITEVKGADSLAVADFEGGEGDNVSDEDEAIFNEAKKVVIMAGKASSSLLQRKLKLGYARAARIIDLLEERGVIGPGEGAKPREVYQKADGGDLGSQADSLLDGSAEPFVEEGELPEEEQEALAGNVEGEGASEDNSVDNPEYEK